MELTQVTIMGSVGVLTLVLTLVGWQVIMILAEVKKTIEGVNKIIGDVGQLSESAARPTSSVNNMFFGIRMGLRVLRIFLNRQKRKKING